MKNAEPLTTPIGLFGPGIGGTTVWKEVNILIPNENTLSLADNKSAPHGEKIKEEVTAPCDANTQSLSNHNAKIIVVACNTDTTNATAHLRDKYKQVSFIGIEPAIKPAGLQSIAKKIGILATRRTFTSDLFIKTSEYLKQEEGTEIIEQIGEGLVDLVEAGQMENVRTTTLLQKYLQSVIAEGMNHLVLGCTHYPYLLPQIQRFTPASIKVTDSGYAVTRQARNILAQYHLLNKKQDYVTAHKWVTNGNLEILKQFATYEDKKKHSIEVPKI